MNDQVREDLPSDVRQWSDAEKAAFALHEHGQRLRESKEMSWTQKLEALGYMNELAWQMHRPRPVS